MSRAITFRFCESASLKFMAEQGLGEVVCSEIRGDLGIAHQEIEGSNDAVQEAQVDFTLDPGAEARGNGFPQIFFKREGVMTFIEIILPNNSKYGEYEIRHAAVSDHILQEPSRTESNEQIPDQKDSADSRFISFDLPELMDFSLEPNFGEAIKALEASGQDFSLGALTEAFSVFKSLPAHKDMDDFKDFMFEIHKKHREKVRVETKVKTN
jgi:hypothetical protein